MLVFVSNMILSQCVIMKILDYRLRERSVATNPYLIDQVYVWVTSTSTEFRISRTFQRIHLPKSNFSFLFIIFDPWTRKLMIQLIFSRVSLGSTSTLNWLNEACRLTTKKQPWNRVACILSISSWSRHFALS